MEKLRPILKQRYWICFGLALILVLFGWWKASGDLAVKISERQTSVKGSFDKAEQGKTDPNAAWVAAGQKENEQDLLAYKTASLQLWTRQQGARDWPAQIRSEMKTVSYFGEVESKETRERWGTIYQTQIEDVLRIAHPFDFRTGEGLVVVDDSRITRQQYGKWRNNPPTSNEIWSNQEDIWLVKALLTSIAKTNDSATRITESQVREIKGLHLRGGDRSTKPGAAVSQGSSPMRGFGRGAEEEGLSSGGMGGSPAVSGATDGSHPGVAFVGKSGGDILTEEFGGTGGVAGLVGGGNPFDGDREKGMGSSMGMGGAQSQEVRYVDGSDKDLGYKTRAFLLDVVIRDERLPDLLAKLTNSDFPVEIVRVEITARSPGGASIPGGANIRTGTDEEGRGGFGGGGFGGGGFGGGGFGGGGFGGSRGRDKDRDSGGPSNDIVSGMEAAKATEALSAAMSDPLLIEVHIGGLLTLYMTPEETEMQAKTEESAAKEAADSGGEAENLTTPGGLEGDSPKSESQTLGPADGALTPESTDPAPTGDSSPVSEDIGAKTSSDAGVVPSQPSDSSPGTETPGGSAP